MQQLRSKPPQKIVINKRVKGGLPFDVTALSDGDLARQLKSFGAPAGPITDSTRPLYQKKLGKTSGYWCWFFFSLMAHSKLWRIYVVGQNEIQVKMILT